MRIHPKRIMCAVDFSNFTDTVLAYGVALCKEFNAKLFLVHAVVDVGMLLMHNRSAVDAKELQTRHIRKAQERFDEITKDLAMENEFLIVQGDPAEEISRLAMTKEIDMIIAASHGKAGFKRFLLGSVTEKLLKTLQCPLLVLHPHEPELKPWTSLEINLKKVLVGCDFSPDSKLAFEYGLSLAQEFQAELHLAHVIKPMDYEEKREKFHELRNRLEKQLQFMVPEDCRNWCIPETALLDGEPYQELMNYAVSRNIDMIVLGIRGHTLWEKLMVGSTTDRVIRHASCPVLAVRQMDTKTA